MDSFLKVQLLYSIWVHVYMSVLNMVYFNKGYQGLSIKELYGL